MPPQNSVVERKNRTLCEMAQRMLDEHRTPRKFWAEAVNTACYVSNEIYLRVHKKKMCYELRYGRTPKVSHFHVSGCKCFILKKGKKLDKFEARLVYRIFFGCASHSRAYRVLHLETIQIVETCEVTFGETQPGNQLVFDCVGDDELGEEIFEEEEHEHGDDEDGGMVPPAEHVPTTLTTVMDGPSPTPTMTNQDQGVVVDEGEVASRREPPRRVQVDHPASRIIGDINERTTRSRVRNNSLFSHAAFVDTFEPKDIGHALSDHNWVYSMHEELENFERNQVWELVNSPLGCKPIGTKWVWKNKEGEKGEVVRNKSRLVAQGYSKKEGIDYKKTFASVARLEAIRILLAFTVAKGFKLHQMDVKSAFLNGLLGEEVYVRQSPGFESEKYPPGVQVEEGVVWVEAGA
jgi:hypothetical protein